MVVIISLLLIFVRIIPNQRNCNSTQGQHTDTGYALTMFIIGTVVFPFGGICITACVIALSS